MQSDRAFHLNRFWQAELAKYNLTHFHMVDCAHGNREFANLSKPQRIALVTELMFLIKRFVFTGLVAVVNPLRFPSNITPDAYAFCLAMLVDAIDKLIGHVIDPRVAFFIESGHTSRPIANEYLLKLKRGGHPAYRFYATHTFAEKKELSVLQAADLLAWQSAKFFKDFLSGRRPPRKDFLSLIRRHHIFIYMHLAEHGLIITFDNRPDLPNDKRKPYLTAMFGGDKSNVGIVSAFLESFDREPPDSLLRLARRYND
jgi:hypothetical protein